MLTKMWHGLSSLAGVKSYFILLEIAVIEALAVAESTEGLVEDHSRHEDEIKDRNGFLVTQSQIRDTHTTKSISPVVN